MRIQASFGAGFNWKSFQEILQHDESLQELEVAVGVKREGAWWWPTYRITLPDSIEFRHAHFAVLRLAEVFRQARDPLVPGKRGFHRMAMRFSYTETVGCVMKDWSGRDMEWSSERSDLALRNLTSHWEEWESKRPSIKILEDTDIVKRTMLSCTTMAARWSMFQDGIEISVMGRKQEFIVWLLGRLRQQLTGSVWSGSSQYGP